MTTVKVDVQHLLDVCVKGKDKSVIFTDKRKYKRLEECVVSFIHQSRLVKDKDNDEKKGEYVLLQELEQREQDKLNEERKWLIESYGPLPYASTDTLIQRGIEEMQKIHNFKIEGGFVGIFNLKKITKWTMLDDKNVPLTEKRKAEILGRGGIEVNTNIKYSLNNGVITNHLLKKK
jgi:hypothetical protein